MARHPCHKQQFVLHKSCLIAEALYNLRAWAHVLSKATLADDDVTDWQLLVSAHSALTLAKLCWEDRCMLAAEVSLR